MNKIANTIPWKISLVIILVLSACFLVSATRYIDYNTYEATLHLDGSYTTTTNPVNNFSVIGFVCANSACSSVSGELWGGEILNSGSDNHIQLTYPTNLQSSGYGVYFFKEGYVPWEIKATWWGTNPADPQGPYSKYLLKVEQCSAVVDNFSLINGVNPHQPLQIDVEAELDSDVTSALEHNGPLDYVPSEILEHYQIATRVIVQIINSTDDVVFEDYEDLMIEYSGKESVSFVWTPEVAGEYKAIVTSHITDEKCLEVLDMSVEKEFSVIDELEEMCYTLLNNLVFSDNMPKAGQEVSVYADKISNAVYGEDLTPLPTVIDVEIKKVNDTETNEVSFVVEANGDEFNPYTFSFPWTPEEQGLYTLTVQGVADNCPYEENLNETIIQEIFVYPEPSCYIDKDCGESYYEDNYCFAGDVYRDYFNPYCNDGECHLSVQPDFVEECEYGCKDGQCLEPECEIDEECGDDYYGENYCDNSRVVVDHYVPRCEGNECGIEKLTELVQECNEECVDGECTDEITCFENWECGIDGPFGDKYCSGQNSTQDFIDYTCKNPGTFESYCDESITPWIVEDCGAEAVTLPYCSEGNVAVDYLSYGCEGGECGLVSNVTEVQEYCLYGCEDAQCIEPPVECNQDSDCGEDGFIGEKYCICHTNVYQNYTEFSCNNPEEADSFCSSETKPVLVEECEYGCEDGQCKEPECNQDSDCGNESYSGNYCFADDVVRDHLVPDCENYTCQIANTTEIVEECTYGCENAKCIGPPGDDDDDDDDDSGGGGGTTKPNIPIEDTQEPSNAGTTVYLGNTNYSATGSVPLGKQSRSRSLMDLLTPAVLIFLVLILIIIILIIIVLAV
ncbi:MAG: hypothetical protein ABIH72_05795 [archaeon]